MSQVAHEACPTYDTGQVTHMKRVMSHTSAAMRVLCGIVEEEARVSQVGGGEGEGREWELRGVPFGTGRCSQKPDCCSIHWTR